MYRLEAEKESRWNLPNRLPTGNHNLSSVLVLLGTNPETNRDEIILTKRTDKVETHKGQVSFPGGFWETHDNNLLQTALRETYEEIGLKSEAIKVLGALDPVTTRGDIPIYPWVGSVAPSYSLNINQDEVAEVLYLPLKELIEEGLKPVTVMLGEGASVISQGIWVGSELVWGATARILNEVRKKIIG